MRPARIAQPPNAKKKPAFRAYLFLLIVAIVYLVALFAAPDRTFLALQFSLGMLKKLLPILGLVSCFMFLNNLLVKPSWVKNYVGEGSGWKGVFIALVGGALSMGPIYVWYGILQELQQQGMRRSLIASFLYARSVKPQLLPLMIYCFGWLYTLILVFYLIIFSIFNGLMTERMMKGHR